jgi:hypothetical protein
MGIRTKLIISGKQAMGFLNYCFYLLEEVLQYLPPIQDEIVLLKSSTLFRV